MSKKQTGTITEGISFAAALAMVTFTSTIYLYFVAIFSMVSFLRLLFHWNIARFIRECGEPFYATPLSWLLVIITLSLLIKSVQNASTLYTMMCILPIVLIFTLFILAGLVSVWIR